MKVIATAGLQVPMADNPRRYITDAKVVTVADDTYYHRRIADGDLRLATEKDLALAEETSAAVDQSTTEAVDAEVEAADAVTENVEAVPVAGKSRRKTSNAEGEQ